MRALRTKSSRVRRAVAAVITVTAAALAGATLTSAALTGSSFESTDGNLVVDGGTAAKDWANAPGLRTAFDKPTGQQDDSFGQGTKEDTAVPTVVDGSIPNNKSDLTRFYVANEHVNGKDFLYLAWERVQEPTGTTNMDFEFNQSRTKSGNGITPVRTAGDVLIKYDLSQGGTVPSFGLHRWVTTGTAATVCEASNSVPCWGKVTPLSGFADGSINTVTVTDPVSPGPNPPRTLSPRTFGEAAINLTDSGVLDPSVCTGFGSAYLKSRSSDSFTAALKDFIAPIPVEIDNCQPATIQLKKVDEQGNPLAGAVLQLFKDANGNGTLDATDTKIDGDCTTALPDGIGTCTYTITASAVNNGLYIGHELTPPPGYTATAPDQTQQVTIGNTAQTFTLVFTDAPVPGRLDIVKKDDGGNPVAGVTFTLTANTTVVGSCVTGPAGTCSISNVALGTYTLDEVIPAGSPYTKDPAYPQQVTVGLGTAPNQGQTLSFTATNPRLHRVITIVCHEGTDTLDDNSVTFDGQVKTSIGALPAALAGKITEADLCTLGGAQFDDKPHGTFAGSVTIAG